MISRLRGPTDALRRMQDQLSTQLQQFVHWLNMLVQRVVAVVAIKRMGHTEFLGLKLGGILCNY